MLRCFFFFNDTATTEIYTLSLHDALPIFAPPAFLCCLHDTRLESAHIAMNFGPVDGMPARRFVGSCTSSTSVVSVVVGDGSWCCHLPCLLSRLANLSRAERPGGSLPTFV